MVSNRFTPQDLEKMLHAKGVDLPDPEPEQEPRPEQEHGVSELMIQLSWAAYGVQSRLLIEMLRQAYEAGRKEGI